MEYQKKNWRFLDSAGTKYPQLTTCNFTQLFSAKSALLTPLSFFHSLAPGIKSLGCPREVLPVQSWGRRVYQLSLGCQTTYTSYDGIWAARCFDFEAKCHEQCESEVLCLYLVIIWYFVIAEWPRGRKIDIVIQVSRYHGHLCIYIWNRPCKLTSRAHHTRSFLLVCFRPRRILHSGRSLMLAQHYV